MLSMLFLLNQPLAAAHDADALRAGQRSRPQPRIPQRAALLGRLRGRRATRFHAAHA